MLEDRLGLPPQSGVVETTFLGRLTMDEIFTDAERRGIKYVLLVSGKHERMNKVDVHLMLRGGNKCTSYSDQASIQDLGLTNDSLSALCSLLSLRIV